MPANAVSVELSSAAAFRLALATTPPDVLLVIESVRHRKVMAEVRKLAGELVAGSRA